jgi:hypothetical protein
MKRGRFVSTVEDLNAESSYRRRVFSLRMRSIIPFLAFVLLSAHDFRAVAQTTYGSIVGNVVDPTGAPVPDVAIIVMNDATGVQSTLTTDTRGSYFADKLIPGQYTVSAEKQGFVKYVNQGVTLLVQQSLRINIPLTLGSVSTQITVVAQAPVIETESGEVGFSRGSTELANLPVFTPNGGVSSGMLPTRDPLNYIVSMPGGQLNRPGSAGKLGVNGSVEGSTMVRVDGASIRDFNGIPYGGRPILEAVGEVKVIGVNAPAEYDLQATILVSTKSGGNNIHGGVLYEGQQSVLNAKDYFLTTQKPFSRRNDYVAWIGGPIKKSKLFYFGAWSAERVSNGITLGQTLPLPAFKTGDFSALIDPTYVKEFLGNIPIVIHDPLNNGAPFPDNIIPLDRVNSVSKQIQDEFYTDVPSQGGIAGNNPVGVSTPFRSDKFDVRIDYDRSERHHLFTHVNCCGFSQTTYSSGDLLSNATLFKYPSRQASVSDTLTFGAGVVNEFKFGYYRNHFDDEGVIDRQGTDFQTKWGIQGTGPSLGLPRIIVGSPSSGSVSLSDTNAGFSTIQSLNPLVFVAENWDVTDNLTFLKGKHTFKTGVSLNRPRFYLIFNIFNSGSWEFTNRFTGFSYSDFLLGYPTSALVTYPSPPVDTHAYEYAWYFQDTYHVTPNLTLNYGVRWEDHRRATARDDLISNFDPATGGIVLASENSRKFISPQFPLAVPVETAQQAGFPPHSLWESAPWQIAPRFGFAYRVRGSTKTVVRGGYGLHYATYDLALSTDLGGFGIFRTDKSSENTLSPGTTIPTLQLPSPYFPGFSASTGRVDYTGLPKDLPNARYHQVNLTVEQALGSNRLEVSYLGNYGTNDLQRNLNQPLPSTVPFTPDRLPYSNFGTIQYWARGNISHYTALQVVGERQFKNGLFFRASYNLVHHLAKNDNDNGDTGIYPDDSHTLRGEYGDFSYAPRQSATITYVYELPFGPGKRFLRGAHGALGQVVGGWQVNGITQFRSGLFFSPTFSGYDPSGTNTFGGRPDRIGNGGRLPSGQRTPSKWFDPAAFTCPGQSTQICDPTITNPIGRFGNATRNILDGPGKREWDMSLFKDFPIRESMKLQFRMEATNIFNTPQFELPAADISNPATAGHITNTIQNSARILQFGARFEF